MDAKQRELDQITAPEPRGHGLETTPEGKLTLSQVTPLFFPASGWQGRCVVSNTKWPAQRDQGEPGHLGTFHRTDFYTRIRNGHDIFLN